jgi:hypothetical protein
MAMKGGFIRGDERQEVEEVQRCSIVRYSAVQYNTV